MRYKAFNLRYKMLAPFDKLLRTDDRATEDCHLILKCIEDKIDTKQSEVSMSWAFGKRHVFLRWIFASHMFYVRASHVSSQSVTPLVMERAEGISQIVAELQKCIFTITLHYHTITSQLPFIYLYIRSFGWQNCVNTSRLKNSMSLKYSTCSNLT